MQSTRARRGWWLALSLAAALLVCGRGSTAWGAVCEPLSARSANVTSYGIDYLPRIDFASGDAGSPECALPLPVSLPAALSVPLYAYNLQGAISGARLRVLATVAITGFTASAGLAAAAGVPTLVGDRWQLDVLLSGEVCGPAVLGQVELLVPGGCAGLTVDVAGYGGEAAPLVQTASGGLLPAVTPRHGAFAGSGDLHHCQAPLCQEPHAAVTDFAPLQTGGYVIELGWTAGDGEFTMIRARSDGVAPTSIFDGELLAVVPTSPGHSYSLVHEDPDAIQYWYTAFSVGMSGDTVTLGSRLECGSFTTATVDPSVPNEAVTWGAVKNAYR